MTLVIGLCVPLYHSNPTAVTRPNLERQPSLQGIMLATSFSYTRHIWLSCSTWSLFARTVATNRIKQLVAIWRRLQRTRKQNIFTKASEKLLMLVRNWQRQCNQNKSNRISSLTNGGSLQNTFSSHFFTDGQMITNWSWDVKKCVLPSTHYVTFCYITYRERDLDKFREGTSRTTEFDKGGMLRNIRR